MTIEHFGRAMMVSAVAIEDAGPRQPWLVLVHGMWQDHRVFNKQIEAFRETRPILAVDLPGHGLSSAGRLRRPLL